MDLEKGNNNKLEQTEIKFELNLMKYVKTEYLSSIPIHRSYLLRDNEFLVILLGNRGRGRTKSREKEQL